jgi:hypothetical protein
MGRCTNLPTLLIDYLKPRRTTFQTKGAAVDSGRNGVGESVSIEFSGGGILTCSYVECFVQAPEEHEHANWLAARLDGSFRYINVPILTDWVGPFPLNAQGVPQPFVGGITHSDGSTFSDGAGYSQATVWGRFTASAAVGAGQISMRIYNATRGLRWSDWFSVYHEDVGLVPGKGHRAYRYWESEATGTGNETIDGVSTPYRAYTLSLSRPLKQAVEVDTRIEFARPRNVMKFATGFTLPTDIEGFWRSNPTLEFAEAF